MPNPSLRTRIIDAMRTASDTSASDWWDVAATNVMQEVAQAFRDDDLQLSADWVDQQRRAARPLWLDMEEAFDSQIDDCFYEFHQAAAAMLKVVATRLENNVFLEAAKYLRQQAEIAESLKK